MSDTIPTLLRHLKAEYFKHLDAMLKQAKGQQPETSAVSLEDFLAFCDRYLGETNPPVQPWSPPIGIGVILADNTRVTLNVPVAAKEASRPGMMQNSGAVDITDGQGFGGAALG